MGNKGKDFFFLYKLPSFPEFATLPIFIENGNLNYVYI